MKSRLLAAPARRSEELIESKEQQGNHPRTINLFAKSYKDPFSTKGGPGKIPKDTSAYKPTHSDTQIIMSRTTLEADKMARLPDGIKSYKDTGRFGALDRDAIFKELEHYKS